MECETEPRATSKNPLRQCLHHRRRDQANAAKPAHTAARISNGNGFDVSPLPNAVQIAANVAQTANTKM